jgi:hypothetical protein
MQFNEKMKTGECKICKKEIPVRSKKNNAQEYCSRICASMDRYNKRYQGTMSGPADRPATKMVKSRI